MTDLPSRDDVKADIELLRRNAWTHNVGAPIPFSSVLAAYTLGELKTAAEWRDTIDYEASVEIGRGMITPARMRLAVDAATGIYEVTK